MLFHFCYNAEVSRFLLGYLGEEMITSVSSYNSRGAVKDPRRKSQSIQFRKSSEDSYRSADVNQNLKQKNSAQITTGAIVAGSVLFTTGYFVLSALSLGRKKPVKV